MGYLEDQILQLPLSTASNSSGFLNDGRSPYFTRKEFQNEVIGSPTKSSFHVVKMGLFVFWLFHLNIITRIPVIPQL